MVDPFSLSLLSLGISSMAIRRIAQANESEAASDAHKATTPGALQARKLLLHAIAEASLRQGQGNEAYTLSVLAELIDTEGYEGLFLDRNVSLDKVFELEGDQIDDVISILSRRQVAAVIYDDTGMPVAAMCAAQESGGPPPLVRRLFKMTGLPVVAMPIGLDWKECMGRVEQAFGRNSLSGIAAA